MHIFHSSKVTCKLFLSRKKCDDDGDSEIGRSFFSKKMYVEIFLIRLQVFFLFFSLSFVFAFITFLAGFFIAFDESLWQSYECAFNQMRFNHNYAVNFKFFSHFKIDITLSSI